MTSAVETFAVVVGSLGFLAIATLIGVKPKTARGVIGWSIAVAAIPVAAASGWDFAHSGLGVLALLITLLILSLGLALVAFAARAVVMSLSRR